MRVKINENSFLARVSAFVLKKQRIALVINSTIFLHNASAYELISNKRWLLHELRHVEQFQRYGTIRFLLLYLLETLSKGYVNNKYEIEARNSENDTSLLNQYNVQ